MSCHAGCGRASDAPFCCFPCYEHCLVKMGRMKQENRITAGEHSRTCDARHADR